MDVNFRGAIYATREAYSDVVARKGSFIAIASVAGFAPLYARTAYAASKHALLGFFETLRTELVEQEVHVLVVCPGFIDTDIRTHTEDKNNYKSASPVEVAELIFQATVRRKPMLVTGIGRLSYLVKRFFPLWYEKLMLRKMRK